jgi:hypothetical protein
MSAIPHQAIDPECLIRAVLDGLDHAAGEHERKWGRGRLRLLVNDDLRARFDRQRGLLDAAIDAGSVLPIQTHAEAMKRAWQVLDRTASEAGHQPLSPEVWECVLPSGETVAIVRDEPDASLVQGEGLVFTLAEVAQALALLGETTLAAKDAFPGAAVAAVRHQPRPELDFDDDIPF